MDKWPSLTPCKHMKRFVPTLILCLFAVVGNAIAEEVILEVGTLIPVRLTRHLNANIDTSGMRFNFEVTEDVVVDGQVVIAKGALAKGIITKATKRKSLGRSGTLGFEARSVEAADGRNVRLVRDNINVEGRGRTGAAVAHTVLWGPIGLFAKGRSANVMMDTEYDLEVASDVAIRPGASGDANAEQPQLIEFIEATATFRPIKKKFHWAKGKVGKDIVMDMYLPMDIENSVTSLAITEMFGHPLHPPLEPKSYTTETSKEGKPLVAIFGFWDVMQCAMPGKTGVVITAELDDGRVAVAITDLETKWKMK